MPKSDPNSLTILQRWLTALSIAWCAICLATALLFLPGASQAWWVELLRYVPYPAWLLPGVLLLSAGVVHRWRSSSSQGQVGLMAAGLSLVAVLGGVMGLSLGLGEPGQGRLRVMSYNIKAYLAAVQADDLAGIAREVADHDPDVLMLQDADDEDLEDAGIRDKLQAMLRGRQVFHQGQYVIASRLPLEGCTQGLIPYDGRPHTYARCTLVTPARRVELYNVHLLTPREGLNAARHERLAGLDEWRDNVAKRLAQARKLATDIVLRQQASGRASVILAGDLNAPEASPVVQSLLSQGLRDAWSSGAIGYGYTHGHSLRPHISFLRIDHILVSEDLGVARSWTGGDQGSEHRPVITDLWLERSH
ncbi:MAG: hypothetical protein RL722_2106 [Pseudomonadota bacterium]|jgi:endonuclease/exonuclease/phosphatase (EEP) superfamily protein YafD